MEKLKQFGEKSKAEIIVRILESDKDTLVVTYNCTYDAGANLKSFVYRGYILEQNRTLTKSNASIECSVHRKKRGKNEIAEYIYIMDLKNDHNCRDRGIGSVLMNELKLFAKELKVRYISGRISYVDVGTEDKQTEKQRLNCERVYHFYEKHGFEIYDGDRIYLSLKTDKAAN